MSYYSNVTEQDLINLRKLAEQQKNERALKIKNKVLKETQDIKLAESLSTITKKLDEVKVTSQELGKVIEKSQPENNTPQLAIENTPTNQPIEYNGGVIYDVELENTILNMRDNTGLFKTHYDPQRGWTLKSYPIKMVLGTKAEVNVEEYNITPGIQKVLTDSSYNSAKAMSDTEKLVFGDILQKINFLSVYQQKVVCLVVIDILKKISVMM